MPLVAWLIVVVAVPLALGLALDRWRRPQTWERTFALCAFAATPVYVLAYAVAAVIIGENGVCIGGRCVSGSPALVDFVLPLAALDFCLLVGGAALGRRLRERDSRREDEPHDPWGR